MNNSVEYKSTDHSGIQSSKSKQKNQKYLASINSGSKTSTAEQFSNAQHPTSNAYQTINALTNHSVQKISNTSLDSQSQHMKKTNKLSKSKQQVDPNKMFPPPAVVNNNFTSSAIQTPSASSCKLKGRSQSSEAHSTCVEYQSLPASRQACT